LPGPPPLDLKKCATGCATDFALMGVIARHDVFCPKAKPAEIPGFSGRYLVDQMLADWNQTMSQLSRLMSSNGLDHVCIYESLCSVVRVPRGAVQS
jgi:hypothetical protein